MDTQNSKIDIAENKLVNTKIDQVKGIFQNVA